MHSATFPSSVQRSTTQIEGSGHSANLQDVDAHPLISTKADETSQTLVTERNNIHSIDQKPASPQQVQTAGEQAQAYIDALPPKLHNLFLKHGLNKKRLAPVCLLCSGNKEKVRETLDQLLREVIACPEDQDLNHHTLHRTLVSGIALGGTGANRWFGLYGLATLLPAPPFVKKPLAIAVTAMAFVSDNLQGAYGANRTRFEGGGNWTSWLAWGLSTLPTAITATMTFRGITALGFGPWAAGAATFAEIVGSLPFYYSLTDRLSYMLKGQNSAAEERVDRCVWLLSQVLKELGDNVSNGEDEVRNRCQAYATVLRLSTKATCMGTTLRRLCLYAPGDKARNIIKEQREYLQTTNKALTLNTLSQEADDKRTHHPKKNLLFNLGIMSLLSVPSSWGEAASVANPLIKTFGPSSTARGASQIARYLGWQLIVNTMMISQTISQSVLVNENLKAAMQNLKNLWESRHALNPAMCARMFQEITTTAVAKKLGNTGIVLLGVLASMCFTLSYAGAINTNTREDYLLKDSDAAAIILPIVGSIPVLLATLNMGKELKKVFLYFGRTLAQYCSPRQRREIPWHLRYQTTAMSHPMTAIAKNDNSSDEGSSCDSHSDDENTTLLLKQTAIEQRTWAAGQGTPRLTT